jgi:hypothetical protein
MPALEFHLVNGEHIAAQLAELGRKISGPIVRNAMKIGMAPMETAARANIHPGPTGLLETTLSLRTKTDSATKAAVMVNSFATPAKIKRVQKRLQKKKLGFRLKTGNLYYGAFVELGHKAGSGKTTPVRFMRKAFDANVQRATETIEAELVKGINEAI